MSNCRSDEYYIEQDKRIMNTINKEYLHKLLQEGTVDIVFTKVNGERREMKATLNPGNIPEDKMPKQQVLNEYDESPIKPRKENPNVLRVFDEEKQEWRSFRLDSVTEVNGEEKKVLTE